MSRLTVETGSDGKKISPAESEDPSGLSAGSDDSEELPDPTRRNVSAAREAVKGAVEEK